MASPSKDFGELLASQALAPAEQLKRLARDAQTEAIVFKSKIAETLYTLMLDVSYLPRMLGLD
jgi:hypothetical protein